MVLFPFCPNCGVLGFFLAIWTLQLALNSPFLEPGVFPLVLSLKESKLHIYSNYSF